MGEWKIVSGSYPYLEGIAQPVTCMLPPYPVLLWTTGSGSYPSCAVLPDPEPMGCFANAGMLHTVYFSGTAAQFAEISCGGQWRTHAAFDRVQCSDGEVVL